MDGRQFDRWTLDLSERLSRRGLGRLSAGVLSALAVALAAATDTDAKKKKRRKPKPKSCAPNCMGGKTCGSNGCPSGLCGTCQNGFVCSDLANGGVCECPAPRAACGNACCQVNQSCLGNQCCADDRICGNACCGGNETCLGNACCPNARVCDDTCCAANQTCLDDACCPDERACDGICCNGNQACIDDACCANANVCDNACCDNTETCIGDACCANARICNAIACCTANQTCLESGCCPDARVCNGDCCGANQTCIGAECCPNARVCGAVCCESSQQVCDDAGACCTPDPKQVSCAGRCGEPDNNCGQRVDCSEYCVSYVPARAWGSQGSEEEKFNYPGGVAVDRDGHVYVTDHFNERIQKFDADGTFLTAWDNDSSVEGQSSRPVGVAVDGQGHVYVTQTSWMDVDGIVHGIARLQKFTSDGDFLTNWKHSSGQDCRPGAVAVDAAGYVYFTNECPAGGPGLYYPITKYTGTGTEVSPEFRCCAGAVEDLIRPSALAVDSQGSVYVTTPFNRTYEIFKFASDRTILAKRNWRDYPPAQQFPYPVGIATDAADNIFVVDRDSSRILKFDSAGNFLTAWGSEGSLVGQFFRPGGIAVDVDGNVYVADTGNYRIQKFAPAGGASQRRGRSVAAESRPARKLAGGKAREISPGQGRNDKRGRNRTRRVGSSRASRGRRNQAGKPSPDR